MWTLFVCLAVGLLSYVLVLLGARRRPVLHFLGYAPPLVVMIVAPPISPWLALLALSGIVLFSEVAYHSPLWSQLTRGSEGRHRAVRAVALVVPATTWWVVATVMDSGLRPQAAAPVRTRFDAALPQDVTRIDLALSGGGIRAALFHAGVVLELEQQGVVPRIVSGVSGGAILGAYYAAGGSPESFRERVVAKQLSFRSYLARTDTFVRFIQSRLSRVQVQEALLDRSLFDGLKLGELRDGPGPDLLLCSTDVGTGLLVGWTPEGCVIHGLPRWPDERDTLQPGETWRFNRFTIKAFPDDADRCVGQVPLSRLVSASGAFPGAFDAVEMPLRHSTTEGTQHASSDDFFLADGGVLDNSGVTLLLAYRMVGPFADAGTETVPRVVVSSDASEIIESVADLAGFDALIRWINVMFGEAQASNYELNERMCGVEPAPIILRVSPHEFYMPRPIATQAELRETYDFTMNSGPRSSLADLSARIAAVTDRKERVLGGDLSFLVDIFQDKLIEFVLRRAIIESPATVLSRMLGILKGTDGELIDGDALRDSREQFERDSSEGTNALDAPNPRFLTLDLQEVRLAVTCDLEPFGCQPIEDLYQDVRLCLLEYAALDTLDDSVSSESANRIFRLGQYLACLRVPDIRSEALPRVTATAGGTGEAQPR